MTVSAAVSELANLCGMLVSQNVVAFSGLSKENRSPHMKMDSPVRDYNHEVVLPSGVGLNHNPSIRVVRIKPE